MFYVFAYSQYYPLGGARDFLGTAATLEAALEMAANSNRDHWHIADMSMRIIRSGSKE